MTVLTRAMRHLVITRDLGRCVRCGLYVCDPETFTPRHQFSLQHRRARGAGGSKDPVTNSPVNLIVLCGTGTTECHGWVESHRVKAQRLGFAVAQWQDPELVPVQHWLHGPAFVTAGGWVPIGVGTEGLRVAAAHLRAVCVARGIPVAPEDESYVRLSVALFDAVRELVEVQ